MIRKMHHAAWRCRDAEETRAFYEDFLGLPLAAAMPVESEMHGRPVRTLHLFFRLGDGSFLAFFDVEGIPFEERKWSDFEMHLASEVDEAALDLFLARSREAGYEVRGPADHRIILSIYIRDPNGYVVELTAKTPAHDSLLDEARGLARPALDAWTAERATA